MAVILDLLKPKPTFSAYLITAGSASNSQDTAVNLLSHLTALLGDSHLVSKSSQAFAQTEHQVDHLRLILTRVMDQILMLSRQYPGNEISMASISEPWSFANRDK